MKHLQYLKRHNASVFAFGGEGKGLLHCATNGCSQLHITAREVWVGRLNGSDHLHRRLPFENRNLARICKRVQTAGIGGSLVPGATMAQLQNMGARRGPAAGFDFRFREPKISIEGAVTLQNFFKGLGLVQILVRAR